MGLLLELNEIFTGTGFIDITLLLFLLVVINDNHTLDIIAYLMF